MPRKRTKGRDEAGAGSGPMRKRAARDRVEIGEVLQRYGMALDEKRFEELDRVFTPDAVLRYAMPASGEGEPQRAEGGLDAWRRLFRGFLAPFFWTQHLVSPPVVELDGDEARSTCRLLASHIQIRKGGGRNLWRVWGVYRDRWRRCDEGWRICEREFDGVHTEGEMLPVDAVETFASAPGRRWRDDPAAG